MAYTAISDFKYGMDRRRPQSSGVPGTLWLLKNAVITRGGDIERAKKFDPVYNLPAGTFGFFSVGGQKYVFGADATPVGMPVGVRYQQLAAPGAPAMTDVLDAKGFDGEIYAVASYADGNVYHFYNGERVTDWDTLADRAARHETVAKRLATLIDGQSAYRASAFGNMVEITAATPGTGFTILTATTDNAPTTSPTATDTTVQANVAAVADVRATGTVTVTGGTASAGVNTISSVTVNAEELLGEAVDWIGSNDDTANALAIAINDQSSTHGYTASAAGAIVTIKAEVGTGTTPNGYVVTGTTTGDVTVTTADMAGGVAEVEAVAQVVTVEIDSDGSANGTVTVTGGTASAGVNMVTSIVIDGEELLAASVDWATSNDATATAIAADINTGTGTHGFSAAAVGAVVTITSANGEGETLAGLPIVVTVAGDVTTTTTELLAAFSTDLWTITLDGDTYQTTGRASATGTSAHVGKSRVYSTAGSLLRYSAINAPRDWLDDAVSSGASFINVSNEVEGADDLVCAAKYEALTALFSRNSIVVYDLQADAELSQIVQSLDNTGTLAPRSVVSYGANDVYYLDETGVRSLRTRDAIESAYASDVGSAIDPFVQEIIRDVGASAVAKASAAIEAADGRYMLAIGQYIIILSQFPSSKIVAWSYIDFGEEIDTIARVGRTIYLRAGDVIYAYGGETGLVYPDADEFEIEATTPFISSKDPAAHKTLEGFDMAAVNTWRVQMLVDPNDTSHYVDVGYIHGTSYHLYAVKVVGHTSHYALKFTCSAAGFASLSSTAVHHSTSEKH